MDTIVPTASRFHLTLHVGMGKTGTTSLQAFLRTNRRALADHGWLYPRSIGPGRHSPFGMWLRSDEEIAFALREGRPGTLRFGSVEELRSEVPRLLLTEVRRSGLERVLLSDEALFASSEAALTRLRHFVDAHASGVRLVCYLRRQDDHMVSRYQQALKWRETRTLAQQVAETDFSSKYDYHRRLRSWQRIVGPDEILIRRFEPDRLLRGSLYDDFVETVGLGIATDHVPRRRNDSLDAESAEFLRILNLCRQEEGESVGLPDNRALLNALREIGTGPTLTLPDADLDRFMSQWAESNARVAQEFTGEPDGELFLGPRRKRNVTTDQRLDPGRLDTFLGVLPQLPADLEASLRRIAEREAARPPVLATARQDRD